MYSTMQMPKCSFHMVWSPTLARPSHRLSSGKDAPTTNSTWSCVWGWLNRRLLSFHIPTPKKPKEKHPTHLDALLRHQPPESRHARLVFGPPAAAQHHQPHPARSSLALALALALGPLRSRPSASLALKEARKGPHLQGVILLRPELPDREHHGLAGRERKVLVVRASSNVFFWFFWFALLEPPHSCFRVPHIVRNLTLKDWVSQGGKTVWTRGPRKRQRAWMWPRVQEELTMARATKLPQRP